MDEKNPLDIKQKVVAYTGRKPQREVSTEEVQAIVRSLKESLEKGELLNRSDKSDTDIDPFW